MMQRSMLAPNHPHPITDHAALRRYAKLGDPEAFEVIAHRYQSMVLATCRRALSNDADAEDATQETFLKLAQQAARVRHNVAAWLHACAMGTAVDLVRRSESRRRAERASAEHAAPAGEAQPEARALWRDVEPIIDRAIADLPEQDRELIIARFLAGRTQADLARDAGVSEGTVSRRLARALDRLRDRLTASGAAMLGVVPLSDVMLHGAGAPVATATAEAIAKIGLTGVARSGGAASAGGVKIALVATAATLVAGVSLTALLPARSGMPATSTGSSNAALEVARAEPGPGKPTRMIGPFEIVSPTDASFAERGVWFSDDRMTISHGTTSDGEIKRARLRILSTEREDERFVLDTLVEGFTPIDDAFTRFKRGQRVRIGIAFDDVGRLVLDPLTEGVQIGRNEPKWFGVRPPLGWPEYGRIPEDAGPDGILGPWAEAERVPVTINAREVRFGATSWTERVYRIIEWTPVEGFSRVLSVNAGGRDPRLIGTRFRLLIREDEQGYSIAFYPKEVGKPNDWPTSFEYSPGNPVRVISFRDDT